MTRGERFVEVAATFLVAASLVAIAFYIARRGPGRLPLQTIRFGLTLGLAYALVRGQAWARWVTIVIVIGSFALLVPPVARAVFRTIPPLESVGFIALFLGYGVIGRGLLYSQSVRAFFAARRAARTGQSLDPAG